MFKGVKAAYTMNGNISIFNWWLDNSKKNGVTWNNELIVKYINRFMPNNIKNNCKGGSSYGHAVCINLLSAFEKYNINPFRI